MEYYIKRQQYTRRSKKQNGPRRIPFIVYNVTVLDSSTATVVSFKYNSHKKYITDLMCTSAPADWLADRHGAFLRQNNFRRFPSDKLPQFISFDNMCSRYYTRMTPNFIIKLRADIEASKANYLKSLDNSTLAEKALKVA